MAQSPTDPDLYGSCLRVRGDLEDVYTLVAYTNDNRDVWRSKITRYRRYPDGTADDIVDQDVWIVDFLLRNSAGIVAVTADGSVITLVDGNVERRRIAEHPANVLAGGDGENPVLLACDGGEVHVLRGGEWSELPRPGDENLLSADVEAPDRFAVGGDRGGLFTWDGVGWTRHDLGTNMAIQTVSAAPGGRFFIGGDEGFCAIGSPETGFQLLEWPGRGDVTGSCAFGGTIVASSPTWGVAVFEGETLVPFQEGANGFRLSAAAGRLFVAEDGAALVFESGDWTEMRVF